MFVNCSKLKITLTVTFCILAVAFGVAQKASVPSRSMTMPEYEKAKTFEVKDLDRDTYVKFENKYILDRYESKKPYFITGDDSLRKRIDLYKLIAKDSLQEIGMLIFYTNEKGKLYKAVLPGLSADPKIWAHYFEDIHAIDKQEKNFVLKLSYVLSKELSFQLYKAEGHDVSKENGTYGMDICFPGDNEVAMADGRTKILRNVRAGDRVVTVDPVSRQATVTTVKELTTHTAKNYMITELLLIRSQEEQYSNRTEVWIQAKILKATPNHPVKTTTKIKQAGEVETGDLVLCADDHDNSYKEYQVWNKREYAGGKQQVYNIVADSGETFIMNSVLVMQKQQPE